MFCKWCGGNLSPSETRCRRCGKEVPARSDCGGFYDLVPNAKTDLEMPIEVKSRDNSEWHQNAPSSTPKSELPAKAPMKKKNGKLLLYILGIVTLCCLVILGIQILLLSGKLAQQDERMSGMQDALQDIVVQVQELSKEETLPAEALPEEVPDDPTEPLDPTEPELKAQKISFAVVVGSDEKGRQYDMSYDLGAYADAVSVKCNFDTQSGNLTKVTYTLKETGSSVEMEINQSSEDESHKIAVSYAADNELFDIAGKTAEVKWQYRSVDGEVWEAMPEDVVTIENKEGYTELNIDAAKLEAPADKENEVRELKCEILLENTEEGSFTLVIEGILLPAVETVGVG